ncbi:hydrogen gas-evolving membrane-bound hydrogenase subunit E [Aureimonas populi]|uniref:Hydrogen gas-evolving membrane-bound hydrogenase subunit E n=1 Tax=Aureimonas populi TaxID=1701758 RepID=A0ABW5CQG5_9HYPH|nr:hydrogen gas-evolving membrane-bound hydrogenase subunit E [Aureimonas populi]
MPAGFLTALFVAFAAALPVIAAGQVLDWNAEWVPSLGIGFAVRLDGLSLAFALLVTGIGALVMLYAASYFRTDARLGRLLVLLSLFAASMLGLVLADDVITFFLFWEGTTITSFLLVGFDHEKSSARRAALQALMITSIGGLALLAGLVLMATTTGSWRFSQINAGGELLQASAAYPAILVLVALGALTKSAQMPFHFWLPNAMAAPTPVSAYLHSATMVKAGVFLLARLSPSLGGSDLWLWLLVPSGAATMLIGSVWALRQTDLKLMLAFTTLMALGQIVMLLGLGTVAAVTAAMVMLLAHALYKAALFLAVGMIDKGAGTREYPELGGLARAMPVTFTAIALAALSMAGVAPFLGFVAKELVYDGSLHAPWAIAVVSAVLLSNALMVAAAAMVSLRPLRGALRAPKASPRDPGWTLAAGPMLLAGAGLICGLMPAAIGQHLVGPMVEAVTGAPMSGDLGLWHGFNVALLLSVATWGLGALLYGRLDAIRDALAAAQGRLPRFEGWYDAMMVVIVQGSKAVTARIQSGRMTAYLAMSFATLAALLWVAVLSGEAAWPALPRLALMEVAILVTIFASIAAVLRARSRLAAITALGGVGAGVAMIFTLYGAIDVAMTQLFVEILVVIFIAVAFVGLPMGERPRFRPGHAGIALALGLGVTLTMLSVLGTDMDRRLTDFFEAASYEEAHGRNIVNVILVDFRGFDTLGEIAVLVIAGIATIAALRAGRTTRRT